MDQYRLWREARKTGQPVPHDLPDIEKQMSGYWRATAAKTKPDLPVAIIIHGEDKNGATVVQKGAYRPFTNVAEPDRFHQFLSWTWPHCVPVTREEWAAALETGRWADGKPAREIGAEERLDIIADTPASEGGNMPEGESTLAEQIDAKITAKIKAAIELGPITSLDVANAAAFIIDDLKALWTMGDNARAAEKKPHDDAAKAVQARWLPIITPAEQARTQLRNAVLKWQRDEQERQAAAERQRQAEERKRIAAEEAERLKREAEERAAQQPDVPAPTADDIEAQAQQIAADAVVPVEVAKPTVSAPYGRAISKAKRYVGKITDKQAFIGALIGQPDFETWLQQKANTLARAKMKLPGMEIVTEE